MGYRGFPGRAFNLSTFKKNLTIKPGKPLTRRIRRWQITGMLNLMMRKCKMQQAGTGLKSVFLYLNLRKVIFTPVATLVHSRSEHWLFPATK